MQKYKIFGLNGIKNNLLFFMRTSVILLLNTLLEDTDVYVVHLRFGESNDMSLEIGHIVEKKKN